MFCSLSGQPQESHRATQNQQVEPLQEEAGGATGSGLGVAVHDVAEDVLERLDVSVDIRQPRLPLCRPAVIVLQSGPRSVSPDRLQHVLLGLRLQRLQRLQREEVLESVAVALLSLLRRWLSLRVSRLEVSPAVSGVPGLCNEMTLQAGC